MTEPVALNAWPTSAADRAILERYDELERHALVAKPTNAAEMIDVLSEEAWRHGVGCRAFMKMVPGHHDADALRRAAVIRVAIDMLSRVDQKRDRVLPILFAPAVKQARRG